MPDEQQQRVTLALIGQRIDALTITVEALVRRIDAQMERNNQRLDEIDRRVTTNEVKIADVEKIKNAVIYGALGLIGLLIAVIVAMSQLL